MEVFESARRKYEFIGLIAGSLIFVLLAYFYLAPYIEFFSSPTELRAFVSSFGILGPLVVIGMQFTQVLLAPLPPVVPGIAGYIFGYVNGTAYSMIGAFLGSFLAIYVSRRYGRILVDYFVKDEVFTKFRRFSESKGILPYAVLFVLPGFPDDALCFIAGLTEIDFKKLVLVATFGRFPGIFALNLAGSSLASSQSLVFMASSGSLIAVSLISVRFDNEIIEIAHALEKEGLEVLRFAEGVSLGLFERVN
ncbi:MAG: putative membrane protein YdjX (TVP38/TMEM64 family) [Candidatus Nanohaloarchaea archaeon]|jgi:uncharacterized membrane protein YdjX (TVP38/TMEM64 family)